MTDARTERNLSRLEASASSGRVMNLALVERCIADDPRAPRIFSSPKLNKAIFLKHTIRPSERDVFGEMRRVGTKIIFPFDFTDLRLGGTSVFINQRDYDLNSPRLRELTLAGGKDLEILRVLEHLPSLDPFLVREYARRANIIIPIERLSLSPADIRMMENFVIFEIQKMFIAVLQGEYSSSAEKFSKKILSDSPDETMRHLMHAVKMDHNTFTDGIFSWRGFLYYKWRLDMLQPALKELSEAIDFYIPSGGMENDLKQYVFTARPRVKQKLKTTLEVTRDILNIYDEAFDQFITKNEPQKFREFLFGGPSLFVSLGEQVGLIDHFTSLWRFRHQSGMGRLSAFEYADFLIDLDDSITATARNTAKPEGSTARTPPPAARTAGAPRSVRLCPAGTWR